MSKRTLAVTSLPDEPLIMTLHVCKRTFDFECFDRPDSVDELALTLLVLCSVVFGACFVGDVCLDLHKSLL